MQALIALACAAILAVAAAFHVHWAFGGQLGAGVSVPQHETGERVMEPGFLLTLAVAAMIAGLAGIALVAGGIVPLPVDPSWLRIAAGACAAGFAARGLSWARHFGLFKAVRTTAFARYDTLFYSPLCLALAAGFAVLALTIP